ncbi:MAG: zeta toxin family protein [Endomicrobium sp.]|jgi:predicted ABC-type ATPase|nr:zeta toxin family protein [Endomicrobium sp.]
MKKEKLFFILAGANGVGKTTVSREFLKKYKELFFLNADETAKNISSDSLQQVRIEAGKEVLKNLEMLLNKGASIVIESTLSGKFLIKIIKQAKKLGYKVILIYTFVDTPDICIERIKDRVNKAGHFVPDEDVNRRFYRSIVNFINIYQKIVNAWILYYNMENGVVVAKYVNKEIEILDEQKYKQLEKWSQK